MRVVEDIKQYSKGSLMRGISTILLNPNFHCVMLYRIAHQVGKFRYLQPLAKLLMYFNRIIYAVDIDYRANLAGGFMLIHGIGTVIGLDVKTQGPVKVYQGVTLGGNNKTRDINGRYFTQPWLMENAIIYANATIVGPIIIGERSVIGANSLIMSDVPNDKKVFLKTEIKIT